MTRKSASCTTMLVGKNASLDGSTLIARNEDAGEVSLPQKFVVIQPEQQPATFHAVLSVQYSFTERSPKVYFYARGR